MSLQFAKNNVYCVCKVDILREVLRLGKSVNESAHTHCDEIFGPLQKRRFGFICQGTLVC